MLVNTPTLAAKKLFLNGSSCSQGLGAKIKGVFKSHKTILTIAIGGLVAAGGFALAITASYPAGLAMVIGGGIIGLVAAIRAFTKTDSIKLLAQPNVQEIAQTPNGDNTEEAAPNNNSAQDKTPTVAVNEQSLKDEEQ